MFEIDLNEFLEAFRAAADVADRKHRLITYDSVFVGDETCRKLVENGVVADLDQALALGNALMETGAFHHVTREHPFQNSHLFYRFSDVHGSSSIQSDSTALSWADLLGKTSTQHISLQASLPELKEKSAIQGATPLSPMDAHNIALLNRVHPPAWRNPETSNRYNAVVIGAGAGGLVTAASIAGLGGRVALVEEHMMGGDCLNFGCVPSKALLRAARAVADVRRASAFGVEIQGEIRVNFGKIMARLRRLRAEISHVDSADRFAHELGVDVFIGRGEFTKPGVIQVNGQEISYAKAVIATGAQPAVPPIPGLRESPYLTNMTIFNLNELPPRLGIIGGGVIGCEMAQAFARFGSKVTLFQSDYRILPREDDEAAQWVHRALVDDGVDIRLKSTVTSVEYSKDTGFVVRTEDSAIHVDALLVATGRKANVDGMGLEHVGVEYSSKGVQVDDHLRTTNADIYAVGDVATRYQFTHVADAMARMVVKNALFFGNEKFSELLIPWCTYTEPEVAHVGLYPRDMGERGIEFQTFRQDLASNDRAILEGEAGFVTIHTRAGTDEILGATIVGPHAGDLISEISVVMKTGLGLGGLASVIHPYPTIADAIRRCGDEYNRTRLTPTVKRLLRGVLAARR